MEQFLMVALAMTIAKRLEGFRKNYIFATYADVVLGDGATEKKVYIKDKEKIGR